MAMRMVVAALVMLVPACGSPQRNGAVYGAVSGAIVCSDTNLPARLINITLQPVVEPARAAVKPEKPVARTLSTYRSQLDGSFVIRHVAPGRYFVIAQKPGYLSPVSQFTADEVDHPTRETMAALEQAIPIVTVAGNQTTTINLALVRAASVSGTITWDDGTPVADLALHFARRDKAGKWVNITTGGHSGSDEVGHFRVSGLPAAEYRVSSELTVDEVTRDAIFGDTSGMAMRRKESIPVYFGDTFFERDAKTLKVGDGEDASANLVIPVSKLHTLSGSLVDARSGHVINAGKVTLMIAGEKEALVSTEMDADEPLFHFEFVPEGEYTLRVTGAQDVTREEVQQCAGCIGTRSFKTTVLKEYGTYEGPFVVQADRSNVILPIPAAGAASPATSH